MISRKWLAGLAAVGILSVGAMLRGAEGDKKPIVGDTTKEPPKVRIDAPYNLLTDLTDDQKTQIAAIHKTELDAEKKLKEQEKTDIMALLSDDQKKELVTAEAKLAEQKKAEAEARHARELADKAAALKLKAEQDAGTTTKPSN